MKKLLILLLFCSVAYAIVYADDFDRKTTWATGDLITSSRLNADLDETERILGDDSDGLISDGNIKSGAAIAETKISFSQIGHDHDGTDSAIHDHITSTTLIIGGNTAHETGVTFNIGIGFAPAGTAHPVIRYNVDQARWERSNDGIGFSAF